MLMLAMLLSFYAMKKRRIEYRVRLVELGFANFCFGTAERNSWSMDVGAGGRREDDDE